MSPGEPRELSKKEEWLRDKALRPDFHTSETDLSAREVARSRGQRRARAKLLARGIPGPDPTVRAGARIEPLTTLYNVWTHEALPILPGRRTGCRALPQLPARSLHEPGDADGHRLIDVLTRVAGKFSARRIEVVSGYRSPKYNLMLRKKGHQVARNSQHMEGHAVDFRIRGVQTPKMLHFVRSLRLGGVGFYPHSQFVHSDTGPIRYWTGS